MPMYQLTIQIFMAAGDEITVEAPSGAVAEKLAVDIANQRFELDLYKPDLQEICISSVELVQDN